MAFEAGELISPNVRLVRALGKGSMGDVWIAEHLALKAHVAVKTLMPAFAGDPAALARFAQEAATAARIHSPHVVRVFDFDTTSASVPFLIMELLEGEDLGKRLDRERRLPLEATIDVVEQTGRALSRAHAAGIIHRDIKPENLFLLDADGALFVKVLDFGVAKDADVAALGMTATGVTVGTPYYMSPEQLLSAKHATPRCDLWSLAVVAYHCLTGAFPFEGDTFGALCVAIDKGDFPAPSTLRQGTPPALDAWFRKALQRAPDLRFSSARELVDAFRAACQPRSDDIPEITIVAAHPPRTAAFAAALLCTAVLSAATGSAIAYRRARSSPTPPAPLAQRADALLPYSAPPASGAAKASPPIDSPARPQPQTPQAPQPPHAPSPRSFGGLARTRSHAPPVAPPPLPAPHAQRGAGALGPGTPFPESVRGAEGLPIP